MNSKVLWAIFKRNLVSYFSNPTGYVFICVFVMASSIAAVWPNDFFNNNLANLDQLTKYLPFILLGFIPAITMSIWTEERRQGTDELLLTLPATDLDVVLGKFLAAVAIFSVSLVFSMVANLMVLSGLGNPDMGLFLGTYVGYWFVGTTMLSVGMVASFLTSNLTIGFVLGVIFNLPLVLPALADSILPASAADGLRFWSVAEKFSNFERGVISLAGVSYFLTITVVMLYLSIVLIGRRHWLGGRDGSSMIGHYAARTVALVVIVMGLTVFLTHHDRLRVDVTSSRLSSLSADTITLIRGLDKDLPPVVVEAYISPRVPAEFSQKRLNLISTLDEISALAGRQIQVQIHSIENFSEEAVLAEEKHGIKTERVVTRDRGASTEIEIYMGVVVRCGLDKVTIPFINRGIPVEYELIRSICTVAQQDRKKLGVLKTDAPLFGQINMQTFTPTPDSPLIDELKKQYDVVEVDPSKPITKSYDVLLAVQPSSLGPETMNHFIDAVKRGQATAIFEDPFPIIDRSVPGTSQPKRSPQQMMMMPMRQPPQPKGNITPLFEFLGVDFVDNQIIWQDFNPYPRWQQMIQPEWIFIGDDGSGVSSPFNSKEAITSGLNQLLFLYAGSWRRRPTAELEFVDLAVTGSLTGTTNLSDLMGTMRSGRDPMRLPSNERYTVAARVHGKVQRDDLSDETTDEPTDEPTDGPSDEVEASESTDDAATDVSADADDDKSATPDAESSDIDINVVLVADIDCVAPAFFQLRALGFDREAEVNWNFQNVAFVMNVLDVLADDEHPFVEIRKRRRQHRTLTKFEKRTAEARKDATTKSQKYEDQFKAALAKAQAGFEKKVDEIRKRDDWDERTKRARLEMVRQNEQKKLATSERMLKDDRDKEIKRIDRDLSRSIQSEQDRSKLWAALLPPIFPIVLGFFVFFHRRSTEHEGVAKSRMR